MAITRHKTLVTIGSLPTNARVASTSFELDATCINAQVHVNANSDGTPTSGNLVEVWLVQTGDESAPVFDSELREHALRLGSISLHDGTNPTDDVQKTFPLPIPQQECKVVCYPPPANNAATTTLTISVTEQRAA